VELATKPVTLGPVTLGDRLFRVSGVDGSYAAEIPPLTLIA
jgi:hypothetical protein